MNEYKEYSELNKLAAINYSRITIKGFVEWCCAHNISFHDITTNLDEIIFYYFDIDIEKIEAERQEIINLSDKVKRPVIDQPPINPSRSSVESEAAKEIKGL